jgi:hypothetical protein
VGPVIRGGGVEQIALLPIFASITAGEVPILLFDVQHDDAIGPVEQIGYHHAYALAAARWGRHDDMLLTVKGQVLARIFADDQAFLAKQAGFSDFACFGKPRIAKQAWLVWQQKHQQRRQHTGQCHSARQI